MVFDAKSNDEYLRGELETMLKYEISTFLHSVAVLN